MSGISPETEEKTFRKWLDAALAALILQEGLKDFVTDEINQFHTKLMQCANQKTMNDSLTCSSCTTANVLSCPTPGFCSEITCIVHDDKEFSKSPNQPCPKGICQNIANAIRQEHRYKSPSWKNSDARKWCSDSFQIAKCYLPLDGYGEKSTPVDVDLHGLLSVIINNKKLYARFDTDQNVCSEAQHFSRVIRNSTDFLLSDIELDRCIGVFLRLLQDPRCLQHDKKAKQAVEKLKQLKNNTLKISGRDIAKVLDDDVKRRLSKVQPYELQALQEHFAEIQSDTIAALNIQQSTEMKVRHNDTPETNEQSHWESYLELTMDAEPELAKRLKESKVPPNQDLINRLQKKYLETKSKTTSGLLKIIENWTVESVRRKHANIRHAWLAYTQVSNSDVKVQLMIETKEESEVYLEDLLYEHISLRFNSFSEEAKQVISRTGDYSEMSLNFDESNAMRNCIQKHAEKLMKDHRNLSIINTSPVRSRGFSSGKHTINRENCVVFYVRKKGFIPVGEEAFQNKYDNFSIDVREGVFYTSMMADNESEHKLRMGCRIFKKPSPISGEKWGTLGGFIEHPQYGLCGLSCAHVLLDDIKLTMLQDKSELSWLDFTEESSSVYLKESNTANNGDPYIKIGRIVKAILTKGDNGNHGMDAAIFQIERFSPSDGKFVDLTNQGYETPQFNSGKISGPSRFSTDFKVFKYGSKTGRTEGKILNRIPLITLRTQVSEFPEEIELHNQYEINGINNTIFSERGDSGSLIMIDGNNGERFCVGILEGVTSYNTTIATPVGPVLEKLNVSSLKSFEADHDRDTLRHLRKVTDRLEKSTERIELTLQKLTERLNNGSGSDSIIYSREPRQNEDPNN